MGKRYLGEQTYGGDEFNGVFTEEEVINFAKIENPDFIKEAPTDCMIRNKNYEEIDYAILWLEYTQCASFIEINPRNFSAIL